MVGGYDSGCWSVARNFVYDSLVHGLDLGVLFAGLGVLMSTYVSSFKVRISTLRCADAAG